MRSSFFGCLLVIASFVPFAASAAPPNDVSILKAEFSADFDIAFLTLSKAVPQDSIRYDILINERMVGGGSLGSTNSAEAALHGFREYFLALGTIDFTVVFQACPQDETTTLDYLKYCGPKSQPIPVHFVMKDRFQDVPSNHPYAKAINYAKENGIVAGYPDNTFHPDAVINRAEFTKIIMRAALPNVDFSSCEIGTLFSDVGNRTWFAYYVCVAQQRGIIAGYPDGTFRPEVSINFAEAAKMLANTFALPSSQTKVWYEGYIRALEAKSAIPLTITSFDRPITRGEMAEMIYRLKTKKTDLPSRTYEELVGTSVLFSEEETSQFSRCNSLGNIFETKFEGDIKKEGFYAPGLFFSSPEIFYNNSLGVCLIKNGYEYDDHGGRSHDLFIFNLETNTAILKGSDGVRYVNDAGSYYVDPKKNNVLTIEEFNNKAQTIVNQ